MEEEKIKQDCLISVQTNDSEWILLIGEDMSGDRSEKPDLLKPVPRPAELKVLGKCQA